jgi:hypothetical protein
MTAATLFISIAACSTLTPLLLYGTSSCPYLCSFILTCATALLVLENIFLHKEIRRKDEVGSTWFDPLRGLRGLSHLTRHVPGDRGAATHPLVQHASSGAACRIKASPA